MNQAQRNFLIKKIQNNVNATVKLLRDSIPDSPNFSNVLLHAVLSGKFEIQPNEKIKEVILSKAKTAKSGQDWLSKSRYSFSGSDKGDVTFEIKDIFVLPEEYYNLEQEYIEKNRKTNEQIHHIQVQAESLITRIQLASDKTLQTMINEVDDMGNISLMDSKLKLLSQ